MIYGRQRLSPTDVTMFYSGWVGVSSVSLLHNHKVERLLLVTGLWLASLALIHFRARMRDGKVLGMGAGFYYGVAVAFYLQGLLLASVYYVVYAGN